MLIKLLLLLTFSLGLAAPVSLEAAATSSSAPVARRGVFAFFARNVRAPLNAVKAGAVRRIKDASLIHSAHKSLLEIMPQSVEKGISEGMVKSTEVFIKETKEVLTFNNFAKGAGLVVVTFAALKGINVLLNRLNATPPAS